ncbi:MAG: hypothetical protein M1829_002406 [Trizodia sp. TS-e1964]|nr:MAG: hypothetical protein M1829_002406 [Trizodia sp. TS-e1964]
MPFPIRALLQILLLRDNGCLNDEQWASVLSLQSHESEFQEEAGERWNTIKLMSNAVKGYSGTDIGIPTIQGLFCRLFVNSFSLVTPGLDSIGTAFDPKPSQINHSCEPNAFIVFDGPSITIRSLHEIKKDEEIFIRDLFEKSELEKRVFALEDSKDKKKLSSAETLSFYQGALREIRNIRPPWPPNRQPLPIIHDTIALEHLLEGRWSLALAHYLVIYFHIDPRSNPEPFHPERVVHSWRLAKLFAQISSLAASKPEEVQMLDPYSLKYPAILLGFLTEVDSNVDRSHGSNSRFARTVRVRVAEVGIIKGHDAFQRWGITKVHMEEEWRKLRKIADELAQ